MDQPGKPLLVRGTMSGTIIDRADLLSASPPCAWRRHQKAKVSKVLQQRLHTRPRQKSSGRSRSRRVRRPACATVIVNRHKAVLPWQSAESTAFALLAHYRRGRTPGGVAE